MKFLASLFESKADRAIREKAERDASARKARVFQETQRRELSSQRRDPRVSESQWTNPFKD